MTLTARQEADAFADAVGEPRENILLDEAEWIANVRQACLIKIHATGWPADCGLTLDMLGIYPDSELEAKAYNSALSLGRLLLLPKRVLKDGTRIRNQWRNHLAANVIPTRWGDLMPQHKFVAWRNKAQSIIADYEIWAQDVYDAWDELSIEVENDIRLLGLRNYTLLMQAGRKPNIPVTEWVDAFVLRCMAKRESREHWIKSIRMWWDKPIFAPAAAQAALAAEKAKNEMEQEILDGLQSGLHDFCADVRGHISALAFDAVDDVLTAMEENNGNLPRNSSKQLKNLIAAVEDLKFWSDVPLETKLARVKGMLDERATKRDYKELESVLREIGNEARDLLRDLDMPFIKTARSVAFSDSEEQDITITRISRESIDFDEPEPEVEFGFVGRSLSEVEE